MSRNLRTGLLGTTTILVALAIFGTALWAAVDGLGPGPAGLAALCLLALPFVVGGLTMAQRPDFATLGQAGAIAFGAGCIVATFVCLYAVVAGTFSLAALRDELGGLVWAAEASLVPGAVAFGAATYVRRILPRWSSACLILGSLLAVAAMGASDGLQLLAAGLSTVGLAGLGIGLIPTPRLRPRRAHTTIDARTREPGTHHPRPLAGV